MPDRHVTTLNARSLPRKLGWVILVLAVLHVLAMTVYFKDMIPKDAYDLDRWQISVFDLDEEESFGTWFSAVILLLAGRLLLHAWRRDKQAGNRWAPWWLVLALGFHYLSLDEVVALHEYLQSTLQKTTGDPHARWTTVGGPVALVVLLAFLPFFFWRMGKTLRIYALLGAALYLGGAVGIERLTDGYDERGELNTLVYNLWTCLEEVMEMAGVVVFLRGLLGDLAGGPHADLRLGLVVADGSAPPPLPTP